jgi:hypothetical protein
MKKLILATALVAGSLAFAEGAPTDANHNVDPAAPAAVEANKTGEATKVEKTIVKKKISKKGEKKTMKKDAGSTSESL